jgi:3-dehydroquinate dehydratase I
MICVSVAHKTGLTEAFDSGAGLIELRLDLIKETPSALFPLVPKGIETIVTCRPGVYKNSKRLELLEAGMKLGADYVDIEIETPVAEMEELKLAAAQAGSSLILSYHNFERTPDREVMESLMIACYEKGGAIAKIATQVNGPDDIRDLLSLYALPGRKVILGMGALGRITRVMGPYLGAEFTFASTGKGGETAPGQLTVKQLNDIYKVIDES